MSMKRSMVCGLLGLLFAEPIAASVLLARQVPAANLPQAAPVTASTPMQLGTLVLSRFATGAPEAFNEVYTYQAGRDLVASAVANNRRRVPGEARVLSQRGDRAVLLLTGHVEGASGGSETVLARGFSGLYEARQGPSGWSLTRSLPIDADSRLFRQDVRVIIKPGTGIDVVTRMTMGVSRAEGILVRLNRSAALKTVKVNDRPVEHSFSGGVLWLRSPARQNVRVELAYSIPPGPETSSTMAIGTEHGFIRDQEVWLPVLNYRSEADMADFHVVASIPAKYQLSLSVPQTDSVQNGVRKVTGETTMPSHGLSIGYDSAWTPKEVAIGDARLQMFTGPDFTPNQAEIESAFRWTYEQLTKHFGPPRTKYFAVSQRRSGKFAGWSLLTNNTIVAGTSGGPLRPRTGLHTGAGFGHETSHAWTRPTGPGRFLLMEGWATFAEAYLINAVHGPAAERAFWDSNRNNYDRSGYEGSVSILTDFNNGGVAYTKGPWIFRMLRDRLGEETFLRGLRDYMNIKDGQPAGTPEFAAAMSRAAGYDVAPILRPWLEEQVTPDLTATISENRLEVSQAGPVFDIPLTVEFVTATSTVRRQFHVNSRDEEFDISNVGQVTSVRLDPDRKLLMRRRFGEVVTFDVEAPANTQKVQLAGDFTSKPIDAVRENGSWRVSLPLTEGFYQWYWLVDGRRPASLPSLAPVMGSLEVRPIQRVSGAFPKPN